MGSMQDDIPRVNPGDPITADAWNSISERATAMAHAASGGDITIRMGPQGIDIRGRKVMKFREPAVMAEVCNIGATDLESFDVFQISSPVQTQADAEDPADLYTGNPLDPENAMGQRMLEAVVPQDHFYGRFGVAVNGIPAGKCGMGWIAGICLCRVARAHGVWGTSQGYQKPDRADTVKGQTYLQACDIGGAHILWIDAPTGWDTDTPALAVVRMGDRNTTGIGFSQYGNEDNKGIIEVLQLGADVTVTEVSPGVVQIERA